MQVRKHASGGSTLALKSLPEVQNRGIGDPIKRTDVSNNCF